MNKIINHIKRWNNWQKYSLHGPIYKLLVLLGIAATPPSFIFTLTHEECEEIGNAFKKGLEDGVKNKTSINLDAIQIKDGDKILHDARWSVEEVLNGGKKDE